MFSVSLNISVCPRGPAFAASHAVLARRPPPFSSCKCFLMESRVLQGFDVRVLVACESCGILPSLPLAHALSLRAWCLGWAAGPRVPLPASAWQCSRSRFTMDCWAICQIKENPVYGWFSKGLFFVMKALILIKCIYSLHLWRQHMISLPLWYAWCTLFSNVKPTLG